MLLPPWARPLVIVRVAFPLASSADGVALTFEFVVPLKNETVPVGDGPPVVDETLAVNVICAEGL